jgi:mitochondrial import receptor subunit TOM40
MQANLDNEKSMMARMNYRWNKALVTKLSAQLAPDNGGNQSVFSVEGDYTGSDFTTSIKAINPSLLEGGFTGMVTGEYLQSITSRLSLGINALWQRQGMNSGPETMLTYAGRYKTKDWIASARFLSMGALQTSYWRRVGDKVEAGVDLNLSFMPGQAGGMMGGGQAEGVATFGTKHEFRTSVVRTQVDSNGRIGCLMEKQVAPPVRVTFVGQIDHFKVRETAGHWRSLYIKILSRR